MIRDYINNKVIGCVFLLVCAFLFRVNNAFSEAGEYSTNPDVVIMKKGIDAVTEEMRFVAYYDYDFHRVFKRLSQFVNNFPYNSYNIEKAIEFIKEMDFRYEYDPKRYPLKEKFYFSFFSFLIFALLVDSILMKENNKEIQ